MIRGIIIAENDEMSFDRFQVNGVMHSTISILWTYINILKLKSILEKKH
jgi:hypothetical protein